MVTSTRRSHEIAKSVYSVRLTVGAARTVFGKDDVMAHPLPDKTISKSKFLNDALECVKSHGRSMLRAAHESARELSALTADEMHGELGALAAAIRNNIEWAGRCLDQHGDAPDNFDRLAASYAIDHAWRLSAVALRIFAMEQEFPNRAGG